MRLLAVIVLVAACGNPPLSLRYRLTEGDSQQCHTDTGAVTTSCDDVTMLCDAYLSVRILKPDDQDAPYISVCEPIIHPQRKLCGLASIDLPQPTVEIPEQTLEVQMAVFPKGMIQTDPNSGRPVCPRVEFGANGLPMTALPSCDDTDPFSCPAVPAIGGRAYYQPGDDKTVVDLGCTNLAQLTDPEVCQGVPVVNVTGTVSDFDNYVSSVDKQTADRLTVGVGEPKPSGGSHEIFTKEDFELERTMSSSPSWSSTIRDPKFVTSACLEVREDGAETTTALTCAPLADPEGDFALQGVLLKKAVLSTILGALGLTKFPSPGGLVVGLVLDENYGPLAGAQVSCVGCTVQYLSDDRTGVVTGGTSASGVFVSTDAPYGSQFVLSTPGADPALGGIVEGKVTIVILRDKGSVIGG